ncbi:hypothetical protein OAN307_c14960 [Octadecabacter antarcticus 307]|uniref:Uncharacterized protein n=1 Tax=Octadecabacter antarcticus 307 TaxID=391626 RepID=M9R9V7_9RHOB|nr:hypothetical protein [Octadecabacter antarcticus]AGI67171.1 hypothetical protein OAN307_c14960 [Octadecabacter antarcticus 307]
MNIRQGKLTLDQHLIPALPDPTRRDMTDNLNKSIYLKASKPDFWAFLTHPAKLAMWFHKPKTSLA